MEQVWRIDSRDWIIKHKTQKWLYKNVDWSKFIVYIKINLNWLSFNKENLLTQFYYIKLFFYNTQLYNNCNVQLCNYAITEMWK